MAEKVIRRLAAVLVADMVGYSRLIGLDEEGTIARQQAPAQGTDRPQDRGVRRAHRQDDRGRPAGRVSKRRRRGPVRDRRARGDARPRGRISRGPAHPIPHRDQSRRHRHRWGRHSGRWGQRCRAPRGIGGARRHLHLGGRPPPDRRQDRRKLRERRRARGQEHRSPGSRLPLAPSSARGGCPDPCAARQALDRGAAVSPIWVAIPSRTTSRMASPRTSSRRWRACVGSSSSPGIRASCTSAKPWMSGRSPGNSEFAMSWRAVSERRVSRIRITGQLIDAETGKHIWAEKYDRELQDIFAVQDDITERVVAAVEPTSTPRRVFGPRANSRTASMPGGSSSARSA